MSIISVRNLKKDYYFHRKEPGFAGAVKSLFSRKKEVNEAVKGISFSVEEGEFIGFIGPNGAGKTTTIKMLAGVLYPTDGTAEVLGFNPTHRKKEFLQRIAFVMGNKAQLWWDLPAMESFYLLKDIYEVPEDQFQNSVNLLSDLLGIKKLLNIQVRKLSLGERMKCEIMASLLHMPKVLFLDEPTIGLDLISQKAIREFLKKYNQETKATIILTSHYLEDIKALCERIIFINKGLIVYDGLVASLMKKFAQQVIIKCIFTRRIANKEIERLKKIGEITLNINNTEIAVKTNRNDGPEISSFIVQNYPTEDLLIEEMPLEDIISRMYEDEQVD